MIYPTQRAIFAMAMGIPLTLGIAVTASSFWAVGAFWLALISGLLFLDFMLAPKPDAFKAKADTPSALYIDDEISLQIQLNFEGKASANAVDVKVQTNALLDITPQPQTALQHSDNRFYLAFNIATTRRGEGKIEAIWARWRGPLGLVWVQKVYPLNIEVPIVPNSKYVTQEAIRFYSQDAAFGQKIQRRRGEGTEFDSLRDYVAGMDKRSIDWKHSARHRSLQAKEFRTERNHNIVFAIDTGRLMCEPLDGIARLDRALNASLLMSYVCLKSGDRVGFFGFDAQPRVYAKPVAGLGSFAQLLKQTAKMDYSIEEANFTLGLSQLGRTLSRRSLIVIFTDFVDTTSAELMVENVARLIKKHLVIFVAFEDSALTDYMTAYPKTPKDVSRAVIAASLHQDRDIVLAKLRRMGVQIIEANANNIGTNLLNTYFDLKNRGAL